jgi:hypothetical protein
MQITKVPFSWILQTCTADLHCRPVWIAVLSKSSNSAYGCLTGRVVSS